MPRVFRWDPAKAATNLRKHHVSFDEALTVFGDPLARIFDDEAHSSAELRELIDHPNLQREAGDEARAPRL